MSEHPEFKELTKQWAKEHPEQYRELRDRAKAKRRKLGFVPRNKWFKGSEGHHINHDDVYYIPKQLHRSIWHCVETGVGMEEINHKAFEWLGQQQFGGLNYYPLAIRQPQELVIIN